MSKIKEFFKKIMPSKRKIIQLYSALLYNAYMKGFVTGDIFQGKSKSVCLPGLNCYSCPGAIGACPLGSIQNALAESKTKLPTYVLGIILLYCIIFGRTICGFLCPVGLLQELLYKIKTPKVRKSKITRCLSYFKYVLLFVLVIGVPIIYAFQQKGLPVPGFCKYICPAGTFEGAIFLLMNKANTSSFARLGSLFTWKFFLLVIFVVASVFIYRFFCRFFCPLGAIYGIFNKLSILGVKVDKSACNHCNACINTCKMDVKEVGDHECIQCGDCMKVCGCKAIKWKMISSIIKEDEEKAKQQEELVSSVDEVEKKKVFKISKKNFNIITYVLMLVSLTTVMVVVNLEKKVYKKFDTVTNLTITYNDNTTFDLSNDNNTTLLYWFNEESDLEKIKSFENDKLNIILLTNNHVDKVLSQKLTELDLMYTIDEENKILKQFSKDSSYPYSVFLDFNDKILITQDKMISDTEYFEIINNTLLGLTVGNQVGDICINKEIGLICSDETFSVAKNRGKITIMNFWFTTCGPCLQELPHFNSLYEEYKDDVTVIAIHSASDYAKDPEKVKKFVETEFKDYSIIFGYDDINDSYFDQFINTPAFPATIIVDQDGVIVDIVCDVLSEEQLRAEIESLLK